MHRHSCASMHAYACMPQRVAARFKAGCHPHLCCASLERGTRKPSGRRRCCAAALCRQCGGTFTEGSRVSTLLLPPKECASVCGRTHHASSLLAPARLPSPPGHTTHTTHTMPRTTEPPAPPPTWRSQSMLTSWQERWADRKSTASAASTVPRSEPTCRAGQGRRAGRDEHTCGCNLLHSTSEQRCSNCCVACRVHDGRLWRGHDTHTRAGKHASRHTSTACQQAHQQCMPAGASYSPRHD